MSGMPRSTKNRSVQFEKKSGGQHPPPFVSLKGPERPCRLHSRSLPRSSTNITVEGQHPISAKIKKYRMHCARPFLKDSLKLLKKAAPSRCLPVLVIKTNICTPITTRHHMIHRPSMLASDFWWHRTARKKFDDYVNISRLLWPL
jgi:hypothetical protein